MCGTKKEEEGLFYDQGGPLTLPFWLRADIAEIFGLGRNIPRELPSDALYVHSHSVTGREGANHKLILPPMLTADDSADDGDRPQSGLLSLSPERKEGEKGE